MTGDPEDPKPTPGVVVRPDLPAALPVSILSSINRQVDAAMATLPKDKHGVATLSIESKSGINAAVAANFGNGWSVVAWAGKKWEEPLSVGVMGRKTF